MVDLPRGRAASRSLLREAAVVTAGMGGLQESHVLPLTLPTVLGMLILLLFALGLLVRLCRGLEGFWQGTKQNYRGVRHSRVERWRRPAAKDQLPVSVPRVRRSKGDSDPPLPLKRSK